LKLEALQPTGSFKIRGVGHACQSALSEGARALVASSGGNAGNAVAYAGRRLGLPVTVVVPETTSRLMQERLRGEGASVIQQGAAWDDSHALALDLARRQEAAYIHPFDDPRIWAGHASLVREVREAGVKPDLVVLAVGGGGLLCGVLEGMHQAGWQAVPVCAVESRGGEWFCRG
ncbi:MAG: pyridoxal-phosphate dependent enzyme, partial [Acidobacteria bacterium]|nr:pyridoxal-phosphate dependent enzyme [Acidobacteriota bacterium]